MENGMQGILMLLHFLCSLQLETVSISILELFTEFMTMFLWNLEQVVKCYEVLSYIVFLTLGNSNLEFMESFDCIRKIH